MPVEEALTFVTSNTAKSLEIYPKKGCIKPGADADLVLLDDSLEVNSVIANGAVMVENGVVLKKGTYEE